MSHFARDPTKSHRQFRMDKIGESGDQQRIKFDDISIKWTTYISEVARIKRSMQSAVSTNICECQTRRILVMLCYTVEAAQG